VDLRAKILAQHSSAACQSIVKWIGSDQKRFDELFMLVNSGEKRLAQCASWPMSECVIANPHFADKHFSTLMKMLHNTQNHEAVRRNTVRLLQFATIPKKYHGQIMNDCFEFVSSPSEKPAVKADALTILHHLSKIYPEIKGELRTIIEDRWDLETAAFRSRGRKILNKL